MQVSAEPQPTQPGKDGIGVCVTLATKEALLQLAATLEIAPLPIAERAIQEYIKFMRENAQLAEAQPRFKNCDALLGRLRKDIGDALVYACAISGLDPSQVSDSAIRTYTDYAEETQTRFPRLWHFIEESPGEIDPAQIDGILSRASDRANEAFTGVLADIKSLPFGKACEQLRGLLELTAHHPGFAQERIALEMIVAGADRIRV